MKVTLSAALFALCLCAMLPAAARAADGGLCPRPDAGSEVTRPPDLYSQNGVLDVAMNYYTSVDHAGRTLFCFVTSDGLESPTLHVNPGDTLRISLTNMIPAMPGGRAEIASGTDTVCGDAVMSDTSINMHFHGTNTAPRCHSDEVIRTLVNPGETFQYKLRIPKDEPPGLYWYHPHVHGISSMAVQGGPTGAIEVEGIANVQPAVAGLPERYIVLRDQKQAELLTNIANPPPNWDVSVNYVPVSFPHYVPAIIEMQTGSREFWRVVNAGANTIMDLKVTYDGKAQPLQIVAFDGVPTGSKDGKHKGSVVTQKHILLPPAGRVEFMIDAPTSSSTVAMFSTEAIDGGQAGDNNPARPLAQIAATDAPSGLPRAAAPTGHARHMRFDDLALAKVTASRSLYFSEKSPPGKPPHGEGTAFFITVDGQQEIPYDPNNPPAITTTQGAVEEWTIRNLTLEVHEFHMHQIHFLVEAVNGVAIPKAQQQLYDTFQVPYWNNVGDPPSITVKMDFRGPTVGDFVYHCHILDHEDAGMMAIIRVLPNYTARHGTRAVSATVKARQAKASRHKVVLAAAK